MSKREYGRFTAEQKLKILREAEQPGVTASEVCRRHSLSPSVVVHVECVGHLRRYVLEAIKADEAAGRCLTAFGYIPAPFGL